MSSFLALKQRLLRESALLRASIRQNRRLVITGLSILLVVDLLEVLPPLLLMKAIDSLSRKGIAFEAASRELLLLAGLYVVVALIQGVCRYGWRMYLVKASYLSGRSLRDRLIHHFFGLSASFFDKRRIGELMSHATNDVDAVRMALGPGLLTFADALFYFLTVPIAMLLLSPLLTALTFLPMLFIPWFVSRRERQIHDRFQSVQESFSRISAMAQEFLGGIRVIKAFAREDAVSRRFQGAGEEHLKLGLGLAKVQASFGPVLDLAMSMGLVLLLFVGGPLVLTGALTLGTFVAFQRFIQKMVWPMMALGFSLSYYQRAVASSERLEEVLGQSSDVADRASARVGTETGRIELRNLSFTYPGATTPSLRAVSLVIEPGMRVAFLGSIGSGKSTLLSLIPRIYPVADGMIQVGGQEINSWSLDELRHRIGYVSQEVFLFSEPVWRNVAYGLHRFGLEGQAARSAAVSAIKVAAVEEDVMRLPQGMDTFLGERGVNLSGGQKQRLTLARALAMDPEILILDDALAAVDVRTEGRILSSLRQARSQRTELLAAHRISTVKDADLIVVLDRGSIVQQGTHAALLSRRGGHYWHFHEQQRLKEELESYLEGVLGPTV